MNLMQVSNVDDNHINEEELDLMGNLPAEIATNILLRLPIRSIVQCGAVRRAWHDLAIHVSKPDPQVVVFSSKSSISFKFEGSPERLVVNPTDHHPLMRTAVKGLILMHGGNWQNLSICNPITREYVRLAPLPPPPPETRISRFGFGVSRSGQYKVVRIIQHECQVYTLGTGQWRSIPVPPLLTLYYKYNNTTCAFVAGNLHWLASSNPSLSGDVVSCFDLEDEVFTSFASPPRRRRNNPRIMSVLEDCLCLCEGDTVRLGRESETIIWLMRDGRNWTKHFVIVMKGCHAIFPIRVLGVIVLLGDERRCMLYYYSRSTKTVFGHCRFDPSVYFPTIAIGYTPNFHSLKSLLMDMDEEEEVQSF